MKRIVFDVGANFGNTSLPIAKTEPETIVYAFEPTPELMLNLKISSINLKNYHVIGKAVSNYDGKSTFYIAGQNDWGCSSLLEFSEKSKTEWQGRKDFVITRQIEVQVIRLDNFIRKNDIKAIDYFHCDTQGSDLNVLHGLGEQIFLIKEGVIEAAAKTDILYKNQNHVKDCIEFLEIHNFQIVTIENNDPEGNEVNIHFKNKLYL